MAEPELISSIPNVIAKALIYLDDIVYHASYRKGIMAMSVEYPENPAFLNEPLPEYETTTMEISGNLAYVWDQELHKLLILDISDPAEPEIVGVGKWDDNI